MPKVSKPTYQNLNNLLKSPDEDWELARLLGITRDAIRKVRQKELDEYNIHARRAAVLYTIYDLGEKATPVTIANRLLRKRNTLSELITKMETDGLVKKVNDLYKKNMVRVILTTEGKTKLRQTFKRESIHKIMAVLSKKEIGQFDSCLTKLRNGIKKKTKEAQAEYLPSSDDKIFELYGLLIQITELLRDARQKELDKYGIELPHSAIMLSIQNLGDKATPTAIAHRLLRERHTLSELLTKMEIDGVIKKINDLNKKNMVRAILTDKGHEIYHHVLEGNSHNRIMSILSEIERAQLKSCLQKLFNKALSELKNK